MIVYYWIIGISLLTGAIIPVFANSGYEQDIQIILKEMPEGDKECLEHFFRNMVSYQYFGYVLLGHKPMIMLQLYTNNIRFDPDEKEIFKYTRLWRGYTIWQKYFSSLKMENYLCRSYRHKEEPNYQTFIFLKKDKILAVIQDNIELFKKKLGLSITAESILKQLETKDHILEEVLKGNHDLLGILLGFGSHNSRTYQKSRNLLNQLASKYRLVDPIIKKIKEINLTGCCNNHRDLIYIYLPYFLEDANHIESSQIRKNYLSDQKLISAFYANGQFLETTLKLLTKEN